MTQALTTLPATPGAFEFLKSSYLTETELAQLVGRNLRTIRRWNAKRIGPKRCKLGRLILYRKTEVERWLQALESGGAVGPPNARRQR